MYVCIWGGLLNGVVNLLGVIWNGGLVLDGVVWVFFFIAILIYVLAINAPCRHAALLVRGLIGVGSSFAVELDQFSTISKHS